ncbi:hypothetical protein F5Y16DRAFT_265495 [Xylariaceae sp. FL0255]|nr:hypothetical protein F5Y16DRAFT_265495 [Xylariaceae sp. FL0255]
MSFSSRRSVSRGMMPAIVEIDSDSPDVPRRSALRRTTSAENNHAQNQARYDLFPPPPYSAHAGSGSGSNTSNHGSGLGRFIATDDDGDDGYGNGRVESPPPLKKERRPEWFIKRGGWVRFAIIALLVLTVVLAFALGLGLGLGLTRNKGSHTSSPPSSTSPIFPEGSYSFITALSNISTACTTNSATFRCYPYTTYTPNSPSSNASQATFLWTIAANTSSTSSSSSSSNNYVISSSSNPFQPQFSNAILTLQDANQDTERLTFTLPPISFSVLPKPGSITGNNASDVATICYFNDTVLSATIYTRMNASWPAGIAGSTPVNNADNGTNVSTDFDAWPYAVELSQVAAAGSSVPDCRDGEGNPVDGGFEISQGGGDCGCYYQNYGLGG